MFSKGALSKGKGWRQDADPPDRHKGLNSQPQARAAARKWARNAGSLPPRQLRQTSGYLVPEAKHKPVPKEQGREWDACPASEELSEGPASVSPAGVLREWAGCLGH